MQCDIFFVLRHPFEGCRNMGRDNDMVEAQSCDAFRFKQVTSSFAAFVQ